MKIYPDDAVNKLKFLNFCNVRLARICMYSLEINTAVNQTNTGMKTKEEAQMGNSHVTAEHGNKLAKCICAYLPDKCKDKYKTP